VYEYSDKIVGNTLQAGSRHPIVLGENSGHWGNMMEVWGCAPSEVQGRARGQRVFAPRSWKLFVT